MTTEQPNGFLAMPFSGQGHPVLVLHAWWGLNDTVRTVCRMLAEAGFIAYAPDLYHGQVADDIADAERLSGGLFENLDQPRADVAAAAAYLKQRAGASDRGLAVIGFSLGAFFALDLSVTAPDDVRAVVAFYGTRPGDYSAAQAAYLGHFAASDDFEPPSEVDALEEALRSAGRPVTFYRYDDCGHWFFEPDRPQAFKPEAAALAWERTLAFLNEWAS